jgi:thymidine kinase
MNVFQGHTGWLEVICGPMFSGKSEELIRRMRRGMIARKRVQVFKPAIDNRYSSDEIVSHSDLRIPSQTVNSAREILELLEIRSELIGIDEANFLGPELPEVASQLADMGKQVIVAGLDTWVALLSRFPPCLPWPKRSPKRWPSVCNAADRRNSPSAWWYPMI